MNKKQDIKISMIAAIGAKNRVIGTRDGKIPWHISEDFQYFKKVTTGFPIIMGSKTFESFGGRILPNRHHIIISRQPDYTLPDSLAHELNDGGNITIVSDPDSAIEKGREIAQRDNTDSMFVIGGGQIYGLFLEKADQLYLTLVNKEDGAEIEGDVVFPAYDHLFTKTRSVGHGTDDNFEFEFVILEK